MFDSKSPTLDASPSAGRDTNFGAGKRLTPESVQEQRHRAFLSIQRQGYLMLWQTRLQGLPCPR